MAVNPVNATGAAGDGELGSEVADASTGDEIPDRVLATTM